MRPSTLSLRHHQNHDVSRLFLREAFYVWFKQPDSCIVPEHKILPLFHELKLFPSAEQVHDMLRTAQLMVRGCNNCARLSLRKNGLTFGEFSVLLADIRKLRYSSILNSHDTPPANSVTDNDPPSKNRNEPSNRLENRGPETMNGPEVFLGGSCNPTTWRADEAIPTLNRLGISFYNPQVSEWTPDLLELEHRAKEKAKVLFFVMDSQTRSTAGAIEVAHIAGTNSKHLVLVLLPYKQRQKILNEIVSIDEYMDLMRNQLLLKHLVRRRGSPVLDNIPLALEYIKNILSGGSCREHPQNIATRLISVRRTYDRVVDDINCVINLPQCQEALSALGYPTSIAPISVITQVLEYFETLIQQSNGSNDDNYVSTVIIKDNKSENVFVTFDGFCILDSYLSVLHQEILDRSCVSPIKGTNLQQPPIYLTDSPEWSHRIVPSPVGVTDAYHSIDTSMKHEAKTVTKRNVHSFQRSADLTGQTSIAISASNTSIRVLENNARNSGRVKRDELTNCCKYLTNEILNTQECVDSIRSDSNNSQNYENSLQMRDIYLGGSCWILTNWRQKYAIPYLKARNITFYTSSLHEGIGGTLSLPYHSEEINWTDDEDLHFNPAVLDASRILLFVITSETRSLIAMTLAAHYIGMGYNVIICVQMMINGCIIRGMQLSSSAIKDYNRGRAYLIDLAKRHGIPVFNDIDAALECAIYKLRIH